MSQILCAIVNLYSLILFAYVIISFAFAIRPDLRPPPALRPLLDFIYALVDPPVRMLRQFIPPLRSGAMALDLAFLAWAVFVGFILRRIFCFAAF